MEDHDGPLLDLLHAAPDIIAMILNSMPLRERFICALACKAWAEAAAAATHSIILEHRMQDLSGLQHWLEKNRHHVTVLQLHECKRADLTALPCCAKLQDLLLQGYSDGNVSMDSRTWGDIASATNLTSVSLRYVQTAAQQADVVSALTALPNLEQLTWRLVRCSNELCLSDSSLLQHMTQLTSLDLQCVAAAALQHLGSLTKLQHLSISAAQGWAAAGCPELQQLKALTSFKLNSRDLFDLPASASQLTALRQLEVQTATPTALNRLQVLTGLTQLRVRRVTGLSPAPPPLQLPGLQHLQLCSNVVGVTMAMSYLASCSQLQFLKLQGFWLKGPDSLVASTMLQHLELDDCGITAADGAADPVSWQQVFPGPGQLTSLQLFDGPATLQQAAIEAVVSCCNNLKAFGCLKLQSSLTPTLARLPGLTSLQLLYAIDEECSAIVQLTGLRQLMVMAPWQMSAVGLRQLAGLQQLTSLGLGKLSCINLDSLAKLLMKDNLPGCAHALINKAPSGSPPDVSSRLLDICDVVGACQGLSIEAVIEAAERELKPSGSPGPPAGQRSKPLTAEALLAAAAAMKAKGD